MTKCFGMGGILFFLMGISLAHANVGETYGFGSRTAALGGSGVAWGSSAFAAYSNPAALAIVNPVSETTEKGLTVSKGRLQFSYGILYMHSKFLPITNVVVDNRAVSDLSSSASAKKGDIDLGDYRDTFGQQIGLSYQLFPDMMNLSIGVAIYNPMIQLAYIDTGETYIPDYVLYRSRTQRPQINFGVAASPAHNFYVGLGSSLGFSVNSKATAFIATADSKTSSMRFNSSIKPKLGLYFGLLYSTEQSQKEMAQKVGSLSIGATIRLPVRANNVLDMEAGAELLAGVGNPDLIFRSDSALFYDPLSVELGLSYQYIPWGRLYFQTDLQLWKNYTPPAMEIRDEEGSIDISQTVLPDFETRNILTPRIGHEFYIGSTTLRVGYAYRQSIFKTPPDDIGNYLDPSRHIISAGVGFQFKNFLGYEIPTQLDFHGSYQHLISQKVTKSDGNEKGDSTDEKIGSPGYTAGGKVFGGGMSFTLML